MSILIQFKLTYDDGTDQESLERKFTDESIT